MRMKTMTVASFKKFAMYAVVAAALTVGAQSCSDGKVEVDKYDNVTTTLVEYEKGQFRIEDETANKDTVSRTVIQYMDGTEKELGQAEVKALFANNDPLEGYTGANTPDSYYSGHDNDIWFLLYWSNMGLHLGRPHTMAIHRGYYSPTAYSRATVTQKSVVKSRTTTRVASTSSKAPVKSSSSYGRSSTRGYSGGSSSGRSFGG
jgi:hypothetical protein